MKDYFFANYKLSVDDAIYYHPSTKKIREFSQPTPYTDTITLHMGDTSELKMMIQSTRSFPIVGENDLFTIHDLKDQWAFVMRDGKNRLESVLICSRDYRDMTVYISDQPIFVEDINLEIQPGIPFSTLIRTACESGMPLMNGLGIHGSMVEKDGRGIVFIGSSGIGKSTQAKLWQKYLDADFLIGDRPCLRLIDGQLLGFGMPWDGKDGIYRPVQVTVCAIINLEQAGFNKIMPMDKKDGFRALMKQTVLPFWDAGAMMRGISLVGQFVDTVPIYHLANKADDQCVKMTYNALFGKEINY